MKEFTIYHPNARCTGAAVSFALHPAVTGNDGHILVRMASQHTVGDRRSITPVYPTFDWDGAVYAKLEFSDICKMLLVLRGECESVDDGRGLYIRDEDKDACRILFYHLVEPVAGYSFDLIKGEKHKHILLTAYESLGIMTAFEHAIAPIMFGA